MMGVLPNLAFNYSKDTVFIYLFYYLDYFIFNFLFFLNNKNCGDSMVCVSNITTGSLTGHRISSLYSHKTDSIRTQLNCIISSHSSKSYTSSYLNHPLQIYPGPSSNESVTDSSSPKAFSHILEASPSSSLNSPSITKPKHHFNSSIKCIYTNATSLNSIKKRMDLELRCVKNVDIIFVTETWFNSSSSVSLDSYKHFKRDRGSNGGGVIIYVKNSLISSEVSN
jgi:hypothetical protein